jgi:hypothetical protein
MFHLLVSKKIYIDKQFTLNSIYQSYIDNIYDDLYISSGTEIDLLNLFGQFSYEILKEGRETFSIEEINEIFCNKYPQYDTEIVEEVCNNLIEKYQLFVPTSAGKISFFHEQILEYFSAFYFSYKYLSGTDALNEILMYKKWDFVLGLAIGFLEENEVAPYINKLLEVDSLLALQCCTYLQENNSIAILEILDFLINNVDEDNFDYIFEVDRLFSEISFMREHEVLLRKLKERGNIIGGAAAQGLLNIFGKGIADELLDEMCSKKVMGDYNYINKLGNILSDYISCDDYEKAIVKIGSIEFESEKDITSNGFDKLGGYFPLKDVISIFYENSPLSSIQRKIFVDILKEDDSQEGFDNCIQLLYKGWEESIFPIYLYLRFNQEIDSKNLDISILNILIGFVYKNNKWAVELIYWLYQKSEVFQKEIRSRLKESEDIARLVFYYCIGKNRRKSFFSLYNSLLYYNDLPIDLIDAFEEEDWSKHADHIICYLSREKRVNELIKFINCITGSRKTRFYELNMEALLSILLLIGEEKSMDDMEWYWYDFGQAVSKFVHKDEILKLYKVMNNSIQSFLHLYVLNRIDNVSYEDFTEAEIQQMLDDLLNYEILYDDEILLSKIVDRKFIQDRLIPMLNSQNERLIVNIKKIIYKASEEHQVRYIEF